MLSTISVSNSPKIKQNYASKKSKLHLRLQRINIIIQHKRNSIYDQFFQK